MSSLSLFYRRPVASSTTLGAIDWLSVLFGWAAAILLVAWALAARKYSAELSDWLFYGFCGSCASALGLKEARWRARTLPFVLTASTRR